MPAVLILVENLPVPLDRRVWQEACALRDAGYEVVVICPQMRGHTLPEEKLEGIQIYRHWISEEAGGFAGFFREYASALFGVRIIYDVHDLWPEMFEAKFGRRGLFYRAVRLAERLTYACADVVLATN